MAKNLSKQWLAEQGQTLPAAPAKFLQFGDGNFLLGFFDWMLYRLNRSGKFSGTVTVVRPNRRGKPPARDLAAQDGLYTTLLRGMENGNRVETREVVDVVTNCIDPYADWSGFLAAARGPDLRFVVSNTTEAGIAYAATAKPDGHAPDSFPAKVAMLLLERHAAFPGDPGKGLVFLPCELLENAGRLLHDIVVRHLTDWGTDPAALAWIQNHCVFCDTLVDRIVSGFPKDEAESLWNELGYRDDLMVVGEPYHFWAIKGPRSLEHELPLAAAGLNVIVTPDLVPYRERKVRVLNGAHTGNVLAAFLGGLDTVGEMMTDPLFGAGVKKMIADEILPQVPLPEAERTAFAQAVLERFQNPFARHELLSISLNSVSKWKARVLPSVRDYTARTGKTPQLLAFSLAALIRFYKGTPDAAGAAGAFTGRRDNSPYPIRDDAAVLDALAAAWKAYPDHPGELTRPVLSDATLWGENLNSLPGFADAVAEALMDITTQGIRAALQKRL